MQKIKVDVVSDVVCPWCYIGKRRLEKAMAQVNDEFEFEVTYLPFQLNPNIPSEGQDQKQYLTEKFGGEDRYHQLTQHVTQIALGEGLRFDYEKQKISPNTFNAHRVIWLAREYGKQFEVKEALMKAYFENGEDLTQKKVLIHIASNAGLDQTRLESFLDSEEGIAEVRYLEHLNHQRGISGVPFYIVNNKYGISGAQPADAFVDAFRDISQKQE